MLRHTEIDGFDFVVAPQGHTVFKAMGTKGMTTEKMNAYLESKGNPTVSWFGERSNAEWYLKNWFQDGGELYQYRFERDGLFFNISPENIEKLMHKFKKNTKFVAKLRCFSGVGLSEREQYTKCALKYSDDYPAKLKEADMSTVKDNMLKRYSIHDLDIDVSNFICKNLKLKQGMAVDGYYSDDVRTDYGVLPIFPLEFATCFAKDLLSIVPILSPRRSAPSYEPMPVVSPPRTPPSKVSPTRSALRSPTPQRSVVPARSAARSPTPQRSVVPARSAVRSPTPQRSVVPARSAARSPTPQRTTPERASLLFPQAAPKKRRAKKTLRAQEFTMKLRSRKPPAATKKTLF